MKKRALIFALFITLLLILPLALAQEAQEQQASGADAAKESKSKQAIQNFQQSSNKILAEDELSPSMQKTVELIFKTHKDKITLSDTIILIMGFIMCLIVIGDGAGLFFEKKWIAWAIGLTLTALGSMSGGLAFILSLITGAANMFKFFKDWNVGALIFTILIIAIPTIIAWKIFKKVKELMEDAKAKQTAEEIGQEAALAKTTRNVYSQTDQINKDMMSGFS